MDISPIKSQRDYRRALKEIAGLMMAKRNTPEGDRLDVLVTLVEAWERKHYPMNLPDPVEAIKYHMDQNGLQPRDLIPFIGSRNRVHEVLNRRCSLTLKMIWRLHEGLGIPAESLIKVGGSAGDSMNDASSSIYKSKHRRGGLLVDSDCRLKKEVSDRPEPISFRIGTWRPIKVYQANAAHHGRRAKSGWSYAATDRE